MQASPSTENNGDDEHFMRIALDLAARGVGRVEPNPMVGCVLVRAGNVLAQGYHRQFGGPHAEVDALGTLNSISDAKDATAYVSLEPCCHQGKTPPCSTALIDAGVARVVIAMADPFPRVDGGGIAQLRKAGIDVTVGVLQQEAEFLNAPYLKKTQLGKPWVIAKWAMTMDGRIATAAGQSKWISNEVSRHRVHQLRGRVDAIAVGMGTVEADDPMLTSRSTDEASRCRVATRVVFCRHRLPSPNSNLVRTARDVPVALVVGKEVSPDAVASLKTAGVEIIDAATDDALEMARQGLSHLAGNGATNVLLEGGSELLASFFAAGEVDECHVYMAPKIFGGRRAPGPIGGVGALDPADATGMELISVDQLDGDLLAVYRKMVE